MFIMTQSWRIYIFNFDETHLTLRRDEKKWVCLDRRRTGEWYVCECVLVWANKFAEKQNIQRGLNNILNTLLVSMGIIFSAFILVFVVICTVRRREHDAVSMYQISILCYRMYAYYYHSQKMKAHSDLILYIYFHMDVRRWVPTHDVNKLVFMLFEIWNSHPRNYYRWVKTMRFSN